MIPLALGSLVLGGVQAAQGLYGLNQVSKMPMPKFGIAPEAQAAYDTAKQQAQYGYAPEQKAAFQQDISRASNTRFQRGVDMAGGNLAGAINAGINSSNLGALNQFASQDAQLQQQKQRYVGQLAGGFQSAQDRQTNLELQRRNAIEQAYGGALKAGLNNAIGSLNLTQALGGFGGNVAQVGQVPRSKIGSLNPLNPYQEGLYDTMYNPYATHGVMQSDQINDFGLNKFYNKDQF